MMDDAGPLKFDLPASARYFTPFTRLPIELRLQIWEDAVYDPGMNFLKIAYQPRPRVPGSHHAGAAPPICKALLAPMFSHAKAEVSNYSRLNQTLRNLSMTCAESRQVVWRFLSHPNTIELCNSSVVTVLDSADVICLDYMPSEPFMNGCRIVTDVECPGLDRVRHVAVRYCHKWETAAPFCVQCGRVHCTDTKKSLPLHIYQFLARHMPNLQTVYLIDFLILRRGVEDKEQGTPTEGSGPRSVAPAFTSQGRKFFEVQPENQTDWLVSSQVFDVLGWVRDNYRRYAVKSTTTRFRHMHPERVQFKVLSCEWDVSPVMAQPKEKPITPKKGCNKRAFTGEAMGARALKTSKSQRRQAVAPGTVPSKTPSAFIFGHRDNFDFSFSLEAAGLAHRGHRRGVRGFRGPCL